MKITIYRNFVINVAIAVLAFLVGCSFSISTVKEVEVVKEPVYKYKVQVTPKGGSSIFYETNKLPQVKQNTVLVQDINNGELVLDKKNVSVIGYTDVEKDSVGTIPVN